ncbi:MAG: polymorphic toxin-type HINT domain-containing protein [Bacteroidota bacterium]
MSFWSRHSTSGEDLIQVDNLVIRKGKFQVYNFTVADYHTYYVGQDEILVHNCGGKKGPKPNGGKAKAHGGKNHNERIDNLVDKLKQDDGVSNIRKNQQQVDVNGNKVGTNRPDVQFDKDGQHTSVEYDTNKRSMRKHQETVNANDPNARNKFYPIKK